MKENNTDLLKENNMIYALGARQMSQATASATPTAVGIGGEPTTQKAVTAAITPAAMVSATFRDRDNGLTR